MEKTPRVAPVIKDKYDTIYVAYPACRILIWYTAVTLRRLTRRIRYAPSGKSPYEMRNAELVLD